MDSNDEKFLKDLHDRNMYSMRDVAKMIIERGDNSLSTGYIVDILQSDYPVKRLNKNHGKYIADDEYNF